MDFSFSKEKMKKECYKLVGISNLGEKAVIGYIKNRGLLSRDEPRAFSFSEAHFLRIVAAMLKSPQKEYGKACMDHIFKGSARPSKVVLIATRTVQEYTYNIYDLFEFCTEGIKSYLPYLELVKIYEILIQVNLPFIRLKTKHDLNRDAVAYIIAYIIYLKIQGSLESSEKSFPEETRKKDIIILADILRLSPFIETIISDIKCALYNAIS